MREIRFRAWCEGVHENIVFHSPSMRYDVTLVDGVWADVESGWDIHGTYKTVPIMQFTGLKDKNGKEVYERDYLRCGDLFVEIVFRGGQFVGINKDNGYEIQNRNWLQFEVIGNAFETTLPSKFDM